MRIRSKLLIILLCLVVPPLVATGYYALRQAKLLGDELAEHTADAFKVSAERELALMVELIGEDLNDNRQMLELSLGLLAEAAGRTLTSPPTSHGPLYFADAFATPSGLPPGLSRLEGPDAPPLPATAEAMSLHVPPGV
jgi:sigma-B regulation protein RsbU (phosphoserine phosphatase)